VRNFLIGMAILAAPAGALAADLGASSASDGAGAIVANIFDGAAPGTITVAGITVYGTIDLNMAYQSHGAPSNPWYYQGAQYQIGKNSAGSQFLLTNNAMGISNVGVKTSQSLYDLTGLDILAGWSFISDVQFNYDPAFAVIADNCRTLRMNNGVASLLQTANGDGSRCGQIFGGDAYGGIKHAVYGQLIFGRSKTVLYDVTEAYDPQNGSYANSLLSSGTYGGGFGASEDSRWNNSLKYKNTIGQFRIAGEYRFEGEGQGGEGYAFGGGVDAWGPLKGLSIDGVWGRQKDAIAASFLSSADCKNLGVPGYPCTQLNLLSAVVSDDEAWSIAAKYNFAELGLPTVTAMGGYELITLSNPADGGLPAGSSTIGDYPLYAGDVNNTKYLTDRQLDVFWMGAKWAITPKLVASGAWYHVDQNNYTTAGVGGSKPTGCTNATLGANKIGSNCAGSLNWLSASLDYQWTKRVDVYVGLSYTEVSQGLASGFTYNNTWNPTLGARFRF
jgi:predicted porin